jgi:tRNA threonylcarbamoyladenosine biosynthesis protein TsaE
VSPAVPPCRCASLADAAATRALGAELAGLLAPGPAILLLRGDLGAGKTCLVQGLAAALGIDEPITSPTFALAQHYSGRGSPGGALVHLDLYRLEQPAAADELFAQEEETARELGAVLAVEWPQRLSFIPAEAWQVELVLPEWGDPAAGRLARVWTPR